jgi:hypothetical protein
VWIAKYVNVQNIAPSSAHKITFSIDNSSTPFSLMLQTTSDIDGGCAKAFSFFKGLFNI